MTRCPPGGGAAAWEPALGGLCCPKPPCWLPCLWWALALCCWVHFLHPGCRPEEGAAGVRSRTDLGEGTGLTSQCSLCQPVSVARSPNPQGPCWNLRDVTFQGRSGLLTDWLDPPVTAPDPCPGCRGLETGSACGTAWSPAWPDVACLRAVGPPLAVTISDQELQTAPKLAGSRAGLRLADVGWRNCWGGGRSCCLTWGLGDHSSP